jgi:hypothetical protein
MRGSTEVYKIGDLSCCCYLGPSICWPMNRRLLPSDRHPARRHPAAQSLQEGAAKDRDSRELSNHPYVNHMSLPSLSSPTHFSLHPTKLDFQDMGPHLLSVFFEETCSGAGTQQPSLQEGAGGMLTISDLTWSALRRTMSKVVSAASRP